MIEHLVLASQANSLLPIGAASKRLSTSRFLPKLIGGSSPEGRLLRHASHQKEARGAEEEDVPSSRYTRWVSFLRSD
jgi:hypothetical protein